MKKTNRETKKLSIDSVTVRHLDTQLTPEQLRRVNGAAEPRTDNCGSIHSVC